MTAKQAIKARCLDCAGFKCTDEKCPLHGLMKSKAGADRVTAIRKYCRWCMNGHPINLCSSPACGIYQYRASTGGDLRVAFKPVNEAQKTQ